MELIKLNTLNEPMIVDILSVWKKSVKKTHHFLSDDDIETIKLYIPNALKEIESLVIAISKNDVVGFMGVEASRLEMLFLEPSAMGQGIGRLLLNEAIHTYCVNQLVVNEQNPNALEFYEHMGFEVYKRSEVDEQGNPYPILYMRLKDNHYYENNFGK